MKKHFKLFVAAIGLLGVHQTFAQTTGTTGNWDLKGNTATDPAINFIGTTDSKAFRIRTNNVNRISITNTGNVGIGVNAPSNPLSVVSGSVANLVNFDGANQMFISLKETGIYRGYIGSYAGNAEDVDFGTGASNTTGKLHLTIQAQPKLTIDASGNVMIGTTTSATGYKLSVYGKVIAEELKVQLHASWPDYVFNDGYKLHSLPETEEYINQNKHLPGIPSSKEIEESGGFEVGDMQIKLLQKIEELTLQVIALEKEVSYLKSTK